jgi:hypothetical protein
LCYSLRDRKKKMSMVNFGCEQYWNNDYFKRFYLERVSANLIESVQKELGTCHLFNGGSRRVFPTGEKALFIIKFLHSGNQKYVILIGGIWYDLENIFRKSRNIPDNESCFEETSDMRNRQYQFIYGKILEKEKTIKKLVIFKEVYSETGLPELFNIISMLTLKVSV